MRTKGSNGKVLKNIKPVAGVYKITNLEDGKIYIGQSSNIQRRIWNERCPTYDYNSCRKLKDALSKYGKDNFTYEILEEIDNKEERLIRESYYIEFYQSYKDDFGYNILQ